MNVPICKPALGDAEAQAAADVVKSGWVVQGPKVAEFERLFAEFVGVEHAVATTSCTTALHAALLAYGIGPGDEVVVPAFTWVATANAVELCGAKVVFADVERDTFNVSRGTISSAIFGQKHPAAIVPVSLFGLPVDPIDDSAPVIEDCACALGAYRDGKHAGADADVACFSFHPRKVITTGEGGMLVTRDPEVARRVRTIRDHGASESDLARHHGPAPHVLPEFRRVGSNYRMTDIQGAIGVVQMRKLPRLLKARAERAARYDFALRHEVPWLRFTQIPRETEVHGYQSYVTWFAPEEPTLENVERLHQRRNQLMAHLAAAGVATRPGTHAVHMLDYYATKYRLKPRDFPNAYLADRLTLALPLYPTMTEEEQDYVVSKLKELGP